MVPVALRSPFDERQMFSDPINLTHIPYPSNGKKNEKTIVCPNYLRCISSKPKGGDTSRFHGASNASGSDDKMDEQLPDASSDLVTGRSFTSATNSSDLCMAKFFEVLVVCLFEAAAVCSDPSSSQKHGITWYHWPQQKSPTKGWLQDQRMLRSHGSICKGTCCQPAWSRKVRRPRIEHIDPLTIDDCPGPRQIPSTCVYIYILFIYIYIFISSCYCRLSLFGGPYHCPQFCAMITFGGSYRFTVFSLGKWSTKMVGELQMIIDDDYCSGLARSVFLHQKAGFRYWICHRHHRSSVPSVSSPPIFKWVCLKMVSTPKPNGFADHYPYEKWLFHWEY